MVKLLGAVMVGAACGYFGFKMSFSLKKRAKSLSDIASSLEMLESEISFSASKLKKAFFRIDRNGLFTLAAGNMENDGIRAAWSGAVKEMRTKLCLAEADSEILLMLGENIGRTDADDQIKNIKYIKSMISRQEECARNEYEKFGKMYRSGGILTGLMIVIILI